MNEALEHNSTRTADEIWALSQSGHVTACSALPITPRVQTSGREEPSLPGGGPGARRAQAILGRLYCLGGEARVYAIALWWTFGHQLLSADEHHLALALTLLLSAEERVETVRCWSAWGKGPHSAVLRNRGAELLVEAIDAYERCPDEGCAGVLGQILEDTDAARSVVRQLRANAATIRGSMRALDARCEERRWYGMKMHRCEFGYHSWMCRASPAYDAKRCPVRPPKKDKGCV